jgi:Domain of unknown function (DUF4276)
MTLYVAPIVEGQTEEGSLERLLQRTWSELLGNAERLQVLRPSRGKRDALIDPKRAELANKVEEAFAKLNQQLLHDEDGRGLILLLLDAESDCPKLLGPQLLKIANKTRSDADITCVLPKLTFENWIMGGASRLAGVNGMPKILPERDRFEERSGAAWLQKQLREKNRARAYKKTIDAKIFVKAMDLAECRQNCPSFDKLCRELESRVQ